MFSETSVFDRFPLKPESNNAQHLIAVMFRDGQWHYDNNQRLVAFTPVASDVLLAEVDFKADVIAGFLQQKGQYEGISRGYAGGDLEFRANQYAGKFNPGEFEVLGTGFVRNHSGLSLEAPVGDLKPEPAASIVARGGFTRNQASIAGLVVMATNTGAVGQALDIIATVTPGNTKFEREVGEQMTIALDEAVRAVRVMHPGWDGRDVRFSFGDKYIDKDGGSAGAAFAVCLRSLLEAFEIDTKYAMTGDITVDGRIRGIGGVIAKIKGATLDGSQVVGIPAENRDILGDLMILEGPGSLLPVQVIAVASLEEAVALARVDRNDALVSAIEKFSEVQALLGDGQDLNGRAGRTAEALLQEILELVPDHVSAAGLLQQIRGTAPAKLSITGSLAEVIQRARPGLDALDQLEVGTRPTTGQRRSITDAMAQVSKLRYITHPEVEGFRRTMNDYLAAAVKLVSMRSPNASHFARFNRSGSAMVEAYKKLGDDKEIIDSLLRDSH